MDTPSANKKRNKNARNGKASGGFDSQKKCDFLRILLTLSFHKEFRKKKRTIIAFWCGQV